MTDIRPNDVWLQVGATPPIYYRVEVVHDPDGPPSYDDVTGKTEWRDVRLAPVVPTSDGWAQNRACHLWTPPESFDPEGERWTLVERGTST